MASHASVYKTSLCAPSQYAVSRSHRIDSDSTSCESEEDSSTTKSSSDISVAKNSKTKRQLKVSAVKRRKQQHAVVNKLTLDKISDKFKDNLIFEHAKRKMKEKCLEMAELKNEIVEIGALHNGPSTGQDTRAEDTQSRNERNINNLTTKERKISSCCEDPKLLCEALGCKPDYIPIAWQEISLQNGIDLTGSCNFGEEDDAFAASDREVHGIPEKMSPCDNLLLTETNPGWLDTILSGPLAQNNSDLLFCVSRGKSQVPGDMSNNKPNESSDASDKENNLAGNGLSEPFLSARSKTMPTLGRPKMAAQKIPSVNEGDRLKNAKEIVDRAIKYKKVFTIQGGYSTIRHSLRRRGWVEKFYKIPVPQKKPSQVKKQKSSDDDNDFDDDAVGDNDDDDDDDDVDIGTPTDDQPRIPPWEEEDGMYGIMSRMVRNVTPSLFWVLKRDAIDYRYLTKDQMVNHYCKAGSFTTKVGLCVNMKNVIWFDNNDHNTFFPRCYRLSHDEEKEAFIDDYRLTACMNIIKVAVLQSSQIQLAEEIKNKSQSCSNPDCIFPRRGSNADKCVCMMADEDIKKDIKVPETIATVAVEEDESQPVITQKAALKKKNKQRSLIPVRVLETAIYQCEKFLASKDHEDIDVPREVGQLTEQQWDDLIKWYYQLVHEEGTFDHIPQNLAKQCESLTRRLTCHWPQFEMDGTRNVWIVKPGAKSRGRGIICYEKLEDMLKLVCTQVVKKDGKYVVQKYIERPLLIYNTKFDIRQWFLVTDWNPLTIWSYRDSYLRFCSQQFTLEDFDQSIHLSNNAIQKHYKNGPRSSRLPEENMWTHEEFKKYLASKQHPDAWDEKIYPQMKRAIVCALLVTQDLVEYRKSSFELYGADFMLTEDFRPWLIEINSSPSMESSTTVTAKLCTAVLDDTLKVVVDRKFDRSCDIGRFELAYKQPLVTVPPYIGISLCVEGQAIKKPTWAIRPTRDSEPGRLNEPTGSDALFMPRTVTNRPTFAERLLEHSRNSNLINTPSNPGVLSGNIDVILAKKDAARPPEILNIKTIAAQTPRPLKEAIAKVSTFRMPGEMEKMKAGTKAWNSSINRNSDSGCWSTDQKVGAYGDDTNGHTKKQTKASEIKKNESAKGVLLADANGAVTKSGDNANESNFISQCTLTPQNTSETAGVNHRRYISKTSASSNNTVPSLQNLERSSHNRSVSVSNLKPADLQSSKPANSKGSAAVSGASWNRACPWCGRGGNVRLDSADPNCRCQKDSVLVSLQLGQTMSRGQELMTFNNPPQAHASKTPPAQRKTKRAKKFQNMYFSTPTFQFEGEEGRDSKSSTPVSFSTRDSTTPVRPTSSLSVSHDHSNTNINSQKVKKMKKPTNISPHPAPVVTASSYYPLKPHPGDYADLQQQCRSGSFSGNVQTFMPSQQPYQYNADNLQQSSLPHHPPQLSRGLLGSMLTTRVRNFLAQKSAPTGSMIKLWPNMAYINSNRCQSPLSVIAQRRLTLKQQK